MQEAILKSLMKPMFKLLDMLKIKKVSVLKKNCGHVQIAERKTKEESMELVTRMTMLWSKKATKELENIGTDN